jgi:hypothetical protein
MSFNPDDYLKKKQAQATPTAQPSSAPAPFDPDAFLAKRAAPQALPSGISQTESALRGAAQGATLGFADEAVGAFEGFINTATKGGSLVENYEKARDESRAANKAAEQANPMTYLGGNLAGGIASSALMPGAGALGVGKAAAAAIKGGGSISNIGRGIVQMGAAGAVTGAIQGAGDSEAKSVGGVLGDAGKGGAAGGAFGGALGGIGKLLPGVRGSVTNDLYTNRVLPITVGPDKAKVAGEYLRNPEMRNEVVKLASKDTVKAVKDSVAQVIGDDVATFQKRAGEIGQGLLQRVDDKMGGQLDAFRGAIERTYAPAISKLNPKVARTVPAVLEEVQDLLTGRAQIAASEIGEATGERLVGAPNAQLMRDVRDALKQALYVQGNPKQGLKDGISKTEARIMESMYAQVQTLFKAVPEARTADELFSKASNYTKSAQKALFRASGNGGKELSNAAMESFVLGKGTAGKVEDLDRILKLREEFGKTLEKATGQSIGAAPDVSTARTVMEFNRLGDGNNTGRSLAPLVGLAIDQSGLTSAFTAAAYNPQWYLRALAKADELTADDKRVLTAIVKAVGRERDKQASKTLSEKDKK